MIQAYRDRLGRAESQASGGADLFTTCINLTPARSTDLSPAAFWVNIPSNEAMPMSTYCSMRHNWSQ
jgi:hypothetical protein